MKVRIGDLEIECTAEEFNKLDLSITPHTIENEYVDLSEIPTVLGADIMSRFKNWIALKQEGIILKK